MSAPIWQPESNTALKAHFEHYYDMMNCTFDFFPAVFRKKAKRHVTVEL
jgi:hypothetical protein